MSNVKPTKNERRDAAREKARIDREVAAKRMRRNRFFIQGGIGLGVLAVVAVIALVVVNIANAGYIQDAPRNMASNGIVLQKGLTAVKTAANHTPDKPVTTPKKKNVVQVETIIDYLCPFCNQFETANGSFLRDQVNKGNVELEIHPVTILTQFSDYTIRAASAAACVADAQPNKYYSFAQALYANQPEETSKTGLSNDKLVELAAGVGAGGKSMANCIRSEKYSKYVKTVTQNTDITGTPTVYIDGKKWTGNPGDGASFQAAVTAAEKAKGLS